MGLKNGDEVILPSFTFIATVECVLHFGLKPVFVDIDKKSSLIKILFTKTFHRKLELLYLFTYLVESLLMNIIKFCKENNIYIIEDCAQSFGSKYNNKNLGTFGDLGAYSFFPSKTLGGIGDGGCIVTENFKMYSLLKKLKIMDTSAYNHEVNGVNSRLDSLNSFVLNKKLKYLVRLKMNETPCLNFIVKTSTMIKL